MLKDPQSTYNRGEDCNPTVLDIQKIAEEGLKANSILADVQDALKLIILLCKKTQTDSVE